MNNYGLIWAMILLTGMYSCTQDQYAQQSETDDLYFSAKDRQKIQYEEEKNSNTQENSGYVTDYKTYPESQYSDNSDSYYESDNIQADENDVDYSAYTNRETTGTVGATSGSNNYVTNNYYGSSYDRYDMQNDWCYTCGGNYWNVGSYYDPWGWNSPGVSFSMSFGTGWGWNNYYGYGSSYYSPYIRPGYVYYSDPFYRPYWGNQFYYGSYWGYPASSFYYSPYYYNSWGGSNAYFHGYNNGYYNGYYNSQYYRSNNSNSGAVSNSSRPRSTSQPRTSVGSTVRRSTGSSTSGRSQSNSNTQRTNSYNQNSKTPADYGSGSSQPRYQNRPGGRTGTSTPATRQPVQTNTTQRSSSGTSAPATSSPSQSQPRYQNRPGGRSNYSGGSTQYSQPQSTPSQRSSGYSSPSNSGGYSSPSSGGGSSSGGSSSPSRYQNRPGGR